MADPTAVSLELDIHGYHFSSTSPACFTEPGRQLRPSFATKAGVLASVGSIEKALAGVNCTVFLADHDVFRGISMETVKRLAASPVIVDGKNLFAGGDEIVYLGIGKGRSDIDDCNDRHKG